MFEITNAARDAAIPLLDRRLNGNLYLLVALDLLLRRLLNHGGRRRTRLSGSDIAGRCNARFFGIGLEPKLTSFTQRSGVRHQAKNQGGDSHRPASQR